MKVALWTILLMMNGFAWFITVRDETLPFVIHATTQEDVINFFIFALLAIVFCFIIGWTFTTDTGKKSRIWIGIGLLISSNVVLALFKDMSHASGLIFGAVLACGYMIRVKSRLIRKIEALAMQYELSTDKNAAFSNYVARLRETVAVNASERIWVNVSGYLIKLTDLPMITEAMRAIWDRRMDAAQSLCKQIRIEAENRTKTDPLNVDVISLLQAMVNCEGMLQSKPVSLLPDRYHNDKKIIEKVMEAVTPEPTFGGSMNKPQATRSVLSALIIDGCFAKLWNNAPSAFPPINERKVSYEMLSTNISDNGLLTVHRQPNGRWSLIPPLLSFIMLCMGIVAMLLEPVLIFCVEYAGGKAEAASVMQGYNLWMLSFITIMVLSTVLCFMHTTKENLRQGLLREYYGMARAFAFFLRGFSFMAAFTLLIAPGNLIRDYIDLRSDIQQVKNDELICKDVVIGSRRFPSKGAVYFLSDARVLDQMKVFSNRDHKLYYFNVYLPHDMKVDIKDDDRYNYKKSVPHNWLLKPHYEVCFTSHNRIVKRITKSSARIHLL